MQESNNVLIQIELFESLMQGIVSMSKSPMGKLFVEMELPEDLIIDFEKVNNFFEKPEYYEGSMRLGKRPKISGYIKNPAFENYILTSGSEVIAERNKQFQEGWERMNRYYGY